MPENPPTILMFAGSAREGSFNRRLLAVAKGLIEREGAQVDVVELGELGLPIFHQDLEAREGIPPAASALKSAMKAADGLLIASPEYNGSLTALLKNTIDWVSRAEEGDPPRQIAAFAGKVVSIVSASPGGLGGLRGLAHLRDVLSGVGAIVLPAQYALGGAHKAFDDEGALVDERSRAALTHVVNELLQVVRRLSSPG